MGTSIMFLRLIPDLRRLNRCPVVSFRYAEAPIWSLKKHPVLTATPVVALPGCKIHALQAAQRISISAETFKRFRCFYMTQPQIANACDTGAVHFLA
jgi:hypothetical protein